MARIEGDGRGNILGGTPNRDSIFGFRENDRLFGLGGDDTLDGGADNDRLFGSFGADTLKGGAGNDILRGSSGSVREIDTLTGGLGRDRFILGNGTEVLYDNGSSTTAGTRDYALIKDFNTSEDVIQLTGPRRNYRLAASPSGLPAGTAIYLNQPSGQPDELIGIVQGSAGLSLASDYFRFRFALNLSELNGSNGFVLKGIDRFDRSGASVSSAGDANGDGFDELIIGAYGAAPNGQDAAGESYVVFGRRDFTVQVTSARTTGRDSLTGTAENDIFVGEFPDDPLTGGGTDTFRVKGSGLNLDLAALSPNRSGLEAVDLTGTGNNSLALEVQDLSGASNPLIVSGNTGDKVTSIAQGWLPDGTTTLDGIEYNRYTAGAAGLLVEATLTQNLT